MMQFSRILSFLVAILIAGSPAIVAQSPVASQAISATLSTTPLSERVVDYQIDAHYDARQAKSLDASNFHLSQPHRPASRHLSVPSLPERLSTGFHIHARSAPQSRKLEWSEKYRASATVKSLEVVGMGDLTSQIKFVAPDDGNADKPHCLRGQTSTRRCTRRNSSVQNFLSQPVGEVYARTGYKRDFIMGAQWFPKVGVWWQGAWNCHQFHSTTEFFADFGTYDVKMTLPQNEIVGATGIEVSSVNHPDGTKTVAFRADDVHDFAWTAEPGYKVFESQFTGSMGSTKIRLLMQPGHADQAERHMRIMKETMARFDRWYGPYPYPQITVVDPPHGGIEAGGMEYPMLITGGTFWWLPEGIRLVELVVEHEFGHQYWYGMVATRRIRRCVAG